jgi:hypothetical protein
MTPFKYVVINSIVEYLHLGRRYTDVKKIICRQYPMCESTFVSYWKQGQAQHYEDCHNLEKKLQEHYIRDLARYKARYGDL